MMKKKARDKNFDLLCISVFTITIALTPWVNQDSLIVPKLIVLIFSAAYFLPNLRFLPKTITSFRVSKVFLILLLAVAIQIFLVMVITMPPIEQQFFGRTGRGLGFATEFSLLVVLVTAYSYIKEDKLKLILFTLIASSLISSIYSILQRFNLDIFDWNTRTNGIIGTLGNPNFQSSFAAMAIVPTLVYFWGNKKVFSIILTLPLLVVIYFSQSTQGYLLLVTSLFVFLIIYFSFKNYKIAFGLFIILATMSVFAVAGMLNKGPLTQYLYKTSVQSRGDFFRTSLAIAQDNPFFGVGLDSLGDFYLMYRDPNNSSGIGEFADNSHNIFLNYAATGGYPLALLQAVIVVLTFYCFFKLYRNSLHFNKNLTALFCAWFCYQLQSLISPANISMMAWNALISGSIIGLATHKSLTTKEFPSSLEIKSKAFQQLGLFLALVSIFISYPYFNVDRQVLRSAKTGDANLALRAVKSFPQSSVRYNFVGKEFIRSNLPEQSLDLARAAVKFNPNAVSGWLLILVNNYAPINERIRAKEEVLRLDPFNSEVANLSISETSKS